MSLWPHLHLLVDVSPADVQAVQLEVRLYLPPELAEALRPNASRPSSGTRTGCADHVHSTPTSWTAIDEGTKQRLRSAGVQRLVVASHPWAKLGGNMLFPVLSEHLTRATYDTTAPDTLPTALLTFNARGVGHSEGRSSWFSLGRTQDAADFARLGAWAHAALGGPATCSDVRRVGYSWGTYAALNAARPPGPYPLSSTMLVAPPLPYFRLLDGWSASFATQVADRLTTPVHPRSANGPFTGPAAEGTSHLGVWVVYGTKDEFTGERSYLAFEDEVRQASEKIAAGDRAALQLRSIDGANHFYTNHGDAEKLVQIFQEWLSS